MPNHKIFTATIIFALAMLSMGGFTASAGGRTISFGNYTWNVKSGYFGPGPNWWTDTEDTVYTDSSGALHLSVINRDNRWYSSEIYLPNSLGYGTYRFETNSRVDQIDKNLVLGLFLYQDDSHEIDIEYSRWGWADGPNGGYTVQPYSVKGNNNQFYVSLQDTPSIHEIDWQPDKIIFRTLQNGLVLKEWTYAGANNFIPGSERTDINFWMMNGLAPSDNTNKEIVINRFEFVPYSAPVILEPKITSPTMTPTPSITPALKQTIKDTIKKDVFKKFKKPHKKSRWHKKRV